jgi:hypothetical protein
VDGYKATGGSEHAIADTAERVFAHLDSSGQFEAQALFLRLVKIGGSSSEDVRCPVSRIGLANDEQTATVADAFTASRLLTTTRDAI